MRNGLLEYVNNFWPQNQQLTFRLDQNLNLKTLYKYNSFTAPFIAHKKISHFFIPLTLNIYFFITIDIRIKCLLCIVEDSSKSPKNPLELLHSQLFFNSNLSGCKIHSNYLTSNWRESRKIFYIHNKDKINEISKKRALYNTKNRVHSRKIESAKYKRESFYEVIFNLTRVVFCRKFQRRPKYGHRCYPI